MMKKIYVLVLLSVSLTACGEDSFFGYNKNAPDEFAIITKAPLIVPPDYNLRPPGTHSGRQKPSIQDQSKQALLGTEATDAPKNNNMSGSERHLLALAGAAQSTDDIRGLIERDGAAIIQKDGNFVTDLLFGDSTQDKAILDPEAEAQRLKSR